MKTRRWMKKVLAESKKEQTELPWSRKARLTRRAAKPRPLVAAE